LNKPICVGRKLYLVKKNKDKFIFKIFM